MEKPPNAEYYSASGNSDKMKLSETGSIHFNSAEAKEPAPPKDPLADIDKIIKEEVKEKKISFEDELKEFYVDPNEKYEKPPQILEYKNCPLFTLENFSTIIGKAKSRKTALTSIICSSITKINSFEDFKTTRQQNKSFVLYFDNEQSKYHSNRINNTVKAFGDIDNFKLFAIKAKGTHERKEFIERCINHYSEKLLCVVIDGIRDLIKSINDEEEATNTTDWLMRLVDQHQIHIINILHQNKKDSNARGHIGSELVNKSETVISIEKEDDKNYSVAYAEYTRGEAFKPFMIGFEDNKPALLGEYEKPQKKNKESEIRELCENKQTLINLAARCFQKHEKLNSKNLNMIAKDEVQKVYNKKYGENKIRSIVNSFEEYQIVSKSKGDGNSLMYTLNTQETNIQDEQSKINNLF